MVQRKEETLNNTHRIYELNKKRSAFIDSITAPQGLSLLNLEMSAPADADIGTTYEVTVQQLLDGKVLGDFKIIAKVVGHKGFT